MVELNRRHSAVKCLPYVNSPVFPCITFCTYCDSSETLPTFVAHSGLFFRESSKITIDFLHIEIATRINHFYVFGGSHHLPNRRNVSEKKRGRKTDGWRGSGEVESFTIFPLHVDFTFYCEKDREMRKEILLLIYVLLKGTILFFTSFPSSHWGTSSFCSLFLPW